MKYEKNVILNDIRSPLIPSIPQQHIDKEILHQ